MPIYEYRCEDCGHELEALQKISDAPLVDCPECQTASLKKKVSAAAFRLKGGGWYETDFKSGKKKNLAGDQKDSSKAKSENADGASKSKAKGESTSKTTTGAKK
ncbi:putative FmdB family regulatory protein [Alteromonadaceae bacterium 2753L.S.0a.02]|nr:putative FmdB family regulatory protein [Alteromonadaceae bacterium 2753L.S.0a.02]